MTTIEFSKDAVSFARRCLGFTPHAGQAELLGTEERYVLLNCHRQWGKTTVTAVRAVHLAAMAPKQQIVIVSPTMRQSQVLAGRCREFSGRMGLAVRSDGTNAGSLVFPNGSVILPLPAHPDRVRGFTANLLILDEAARVPDEVYAAATPMLAATQGDLWLLSTPHGRAGFFYEEWTAKDAGQDRWFRLEGKAEGGQRVTEEFLARERRRKTAEQFAEEYACDFVTAGRNVFPEEWLERSFSRDVPPFDWMSRENLENVRHAPSYYLSFDPARLRDYAALVLLEYRPIYSGMRDRATFEPLFRRELRVVHIERFPRGTPYRELVTRVGRLCQHPHLAHRTQLLVDATGQGLPVVEMFREARLPVNLVPITITGGQQVTINGSGRSVPKADLIGGLEVLLERGLLRIAADLPHADLLREELRRFERTSRRGGRLVYGPGESTGHDDLVMAMAMGGWWVWTNRRAALLGPELKALG